jgi:epoxide hydrolase-like predicted phosphatase
MRPLSVASEMTTPFSGKIQAILFDLMGVLLFRKDDYLPDEIVDAIDEYIGGVTDDRSFRQEMLNRYRLTDPEFDALLARIADKYAPFMPLWDLLPELRKRYRLGIINNGTFLTYPLLDARLGLSRRFDLFISSAQEGVCKPDARIYRQSCERLGLVPDECLFMDDTEKNIIGARQVGMQVIHWPERFSGLQALHDWLRNETAWDLSKEK